MIRAIFTEDVNTVTVSGLTQWDYGQVLHISGIDLPDAAQVHFASQSLYAEAIIRLSRKVSDGYEVDIPNECLREPYDIKAWVYEVDSGHGETIKTVNLPLFKRTRPKDFVNPPDPAEETLLNEWIEKINENIQDNKDFKADITASEVERKANEEQRKTNEQGRVTAEAGRVEAESARANAEQGRVTAEQQRVSAEQARAAAETQRQQAEATRASQESERVQAETTRVSEWENYKQQIEQVLSGTMIDDTQAGANTTYSSNKIETLVNSVSNEVDVVNGKIPSPTMTVTIETTDWSDGIYTLTDSRITATSNQEWLPPILTAENTEEIKAIQSANIQDYGQSAGQAQIKCMGNVPTVTVNLRVIFRGDK